MSAEVPTKEALDTLKDKYLIFQLGDQEFALDILHVAEIVGMQKITPLPFEADFVKGVINLRGQVIPVIDARLRLGLEERDYDDRTCIIINRIHEMFIGLVVDAVSEVMVIPPQQIEPPPRLRKDRRTSFLQGLAKAPQGVKMVLNVQKVLFIEEMGALQNTMSVTEVN